MFCRCSESEKVFCCWELDLLDVPVGTELAVAEGGVLRLLADEGLPSLVSIMIGSSSWSPKVPCTPLGDEEGGGSPGGSFVGNGHDVRRSCSAPVVMLARVATRRNRSGRFKSNCYKSRWQHQVVNQWVLLEDLNVRYKS